MMSSSDEILAALLDECYERLRAGESLSACLQRHPEHAHVLAPLLETITQVSRLRPVPERSQEMVARTRAQFLARARRLRASQSVHPTTLRERLAEGWAAFLASFSWPRTVPAGLLTVLLAVVLVGALATGVITASATALPGDPLYAVKTATEQVRIFLARDPAARTALLEQFSQERLREAKAVVEQQRSVSSMALDAVIEAIEGNQWRVSGLTLLITPETIIEGYPVVGAHIQGTVRAPGDKILIAIHIEVEQPFFTPAPTMTLPPPTATPSPRPTATDTPQPEPPSARVVGGWPIHTAVMPTDLPTATDTATPTATATATATPTPTATVTLAPSPTWARPEIKKRYSGWVKRIDGSRWTIGDITVETSGETKFYGNPGVGSFVEVIILVRPDGSYLALEIREQGTHQATPEPLEFTDQINAINGDQWTIGRFVVRVTGETQIEGNPEVGSWVECKAERRAGGEIWALRIKVLILGEVEFQGMIESASGSVWRIAGQSLQITERTQIFGEVVVGREAQVRAVRRPDGVLEALLIYVLPEETPTPTFTATSTATASPSFTPLPTVPMEPVETPSSTPTGEVATPSPTLSPVPETPTPTAEPPTPTPTMPMEPVETPSSTPTGEVATPSPRLSPVPKTPTPTAMSAEIASELPTPTMSIEPVKMSTMTPVVEIATPSPTLSPIAAMASK